MTQEFVSPGRRHTRRSSAARLSVPGGSTSAVRSLKVSPIAMDQYSVSTGSPPPPQSEESSLEERYLDEPPPGMPSEDDDGNIIRYVEVPVVEEVIRHVPKRQEVVIEKYVPRVEEVWVDKIVEVPEVVYQDKYIDVPVHEEFITHVTKHEVVEVPKEYIRHVPKVKTVTVEKTVEIPGEIVHVPRPYIVENKVPVPRVIDKQVPVLVSQIVQPVLTGLAEEEKLVQVVNYEPHFHVVDVPVVRPLHSCLVNRGVMHEECRVVQVPPGQYNTILRHLNRHLDCPGKSQYLPYVTDRSTGDVMFVDEQACLPKGPVAVPMPLLNSPTPAYAGANINGPIVPSQMPIVEDRGTKRKHKHRHHHHHRHRRS